MENIISMSGEASIAVIRKEPRMGYELTFKVLMAGVEETYLDGLNCEIEITDLCDDSETPEGGCNISMTKMLDTSQGSIAKDIVGYDNECLKLCEVVTKLLK